MNRTDAIALQQRLLDHISSNSCDLADTSVSVPAEQFTDQARHTAETQRLFRDTPQVIGFAGEVAHADDYITRDILDVPVLVTRDQSGQLRAFVNACAHKGARVAQGAGNRARLVCRFHGWSYNSDGSLHARPQDQCFETASELCGLTPLPVSERSGLIVVSINPAGSQRAVDQFLQSIEPQFSGFRFNQRVYVDERRLSVKANWKLVTGLSLESYHFRTLHRDSVATMLHDNFVYDTFGQHSRWAFPLKGFDNTLRDKDSAQWPEQLAGAISHVLFPGTVVIVNPADAQIIRAEPGDTPGESVVHFLGVRDTQTDPEAAKKTFEFGLDVFANEDLPAAAECQQGLAAGRDRIFIGANEPVVQHAHRVWDAALRD